MGSKYFEYISNPLFFWQSIFPFDQTFITSFIYKIWLMHRTKNKNYNIGDKPYLYQFCVERNIPCIQCIETEQDLAKYKCDDFIIKAVYGGFGKDMLLTKEPKKY